MTARSLIVIAATLAALSVMAMPLPEALSEDARRTLVIAIIMAALWMTEALPLFVTALIPLIAFPLAAIAPLATVSQAYSNPLVLLFMGGFMLAAAMQRWQLHRRVAMIALRLAGSRTDLQILAVMLVTAFLSMWISNTATTMVMMPIGLAILAADAQRAPVDTHLDRKARQGTASAPETHADREGGERDEAATALMLAIAYAATIGGMGTLIGTPPNALFAGFVEKTYGISISFGQWMLLGVPIVAVLLPLTWLLLTRVAFKLPDETAKAGTGTGPALAPTPPLTAGQRLVAIILVLTALAWIARPLLTTWFDLPGLTDAGIALTAVLALFALPRALTDGKPALTWDDVRTIRWDVLILFGGGLALADALQSTGLAQWIASGATLLADIPLAVFILAMMIIIVYLGELASNTAMAAIFLPIAAATAVGFNTEPLALLVPVALAASLGFMLPVATPPNAIVYGSGVVTSGDMLFAGAILDVISIAIVFALSMALFPLVFS